MERFQHLESSSLADRARDKIRAAILEGKLKPGEKITIERIAEELGISRTPVREALKALETDSMVRLIPHRGAVVEPFAWQEIRHRYAIRAMLEGYAAELACEADDKTLIVALDRNRQRLNKALASLESKGKGKVHQLVELNQEFHSLVRNASGSPTLIRLIDSLRQPSSFSEFFWSVAEYREMSIRHHEEITSAFRDGDAKHARLLTEQHLLAAGEMIAVAAGPGVGSLNPDLASPDD
jgi:GntR family transcriptional regulator of vanillate catabolism